MSTNDSGPLEPHSTWLTTVLAVVAVVLFVSIGWRRRSATLPPGSTWLLLKQSWRSESARPHVVLAKCRQVYGGIFSLRFLGTTAVVLSDWESVHEALVEQKHVFCGKPKMVNVDKFVFNADILSLRGPVWKAKRQFVMQLLFRLGCHRSSTMDEILNDETNRLMATFEAHDGREVAMKGAFHVPVVNTLMTIVAGKTYDLQDRSLLAQLDDVETAFAFIMESSPLLLMPILRYLPGDPFSLKPLEETARRQFGFFERLVDEHIRSFQSDDLRDFVDVYLSKILERKSDDDAQAHIYDKKHLTGALMNMFIAVLKTTATTLEWAMLYMATWPRIQERVQEELDRVVGSREVTTGDISELPYTQAAIMEVQRFASVLHVGVNCAMASTRVRGYTVPKETIVIVNYYALNYDEKLWGDPGVFRPDRFIDKSNGKISKPDHFIPFSTGSRECIAQRMGQMQLHAFFARLLQRFTFQTVTGKHLPSLEPDDRGTLSPKPFSLVVRQRTKIH